MILFASARAQEEAAVRLAELKDEPLVSAPNDTYLRRLVDAAAMSAGFTLHYSVTVDRLAEHPPSRLCRSRDRHPSLGLHSGHSVGRGATRRCWSSPLSVTVGLISSRSRYMTPAAAGMAALIREQMAVKAKSYGPGPGLRDSEPGIRGSV